MRTKYPPWSACAREDSPLEALAHDSPSVRSARARCPTPTLTMPSWRRVSTGAAATAMWRCCSSRSHLRLSLWRSPDWRLATIQTRRDDGELRRCFAGDLAPEFAEESLISISLKIAGWTMSAVIQLAL